MLTIKYELEWSCDGYGHGEVELISGSKRPKPGDHVTVKPRKDVKFYNGNDVLHTFDGIKQFEGVISAKTVTDKYDDNRDIVYTVEVYPSEFL